MRPSRRTLLRSGLALPLSVSLGGALVGPFARRARAASTGDRRFVFVLAPGGWDVTRVFAPEFGNAAVAMEDRADPLTIGNLTIVDHADRPSVRAFYEAWHQSSVVFNGLLVRSIAHEICLTIALTGDTSGARPDWATLLAGAAADRYAVPHLVLGGPAFVGDLATVVGRTGSNGQLERLIDGSALTLADGAAGGPTAGAEAVLDRFVAARAASMASAARSAGAQGMFGAVNDAVAYAARLKAAAGTLSLTAGPTVAEQAPLAVQALASGLSRCVTLAAEQEVLGWDTHTDNDANQSPLWEELFAGLGVLLQLLADTPSPDGGTLGDNTVVVVLSELGRTPNLNGFAGKDHWPYTSALVVGPGLTGDRMVGAFDERFYGLPVDPATGEAVDDDAVPSLSAEALGATLLALGGVDPEELVPGVDVLTGVLG